jgi:hypothetical protein
LTGGFASPILDQLSSVRLELIMSRTEFLKATISKVEIDPKELVFRDFGITREQDAALAELADQMQLSTNSVMRRVLEHVLRDLEETTAQGR